MQVIEKLLKRGGAFDRGDGSVFQTWHAVTQDFALIEASVPDVAQAYTKLEAAQGRPARAKRTFGGLESQFRTLLPLSRDMSRVLVLPTQAQGWTALFRSGVEGSGPGEIAPQIAHHLKTRAMQICASLPNSPPNHAWSLWDCRTNDKPGTDIEFAIEAPRKARLSDRAELELTLAEFEIPMPSDALLAPSARLGGQCLWCPIVSRTPSYSLKQVLAGHPWRS
ncbi:MAG: hypothetical protein AB8B71_17145 [Paracoccaceae bacterium]